jgi:hypothetical protein
LIGKKQLEQQQQQQQQQNMELELQMLQMVILSKRIIKVVVLVLEIKFHQITVPKIYGFLN